MARILMVSKPIAPPWNDGSKNLVKTLATHMSRHDATVLTRRAAEVGIAGVRAETVYRSTGHFAPALRDNAAVLSRLLLGETHALWHFFFAPNPLSSYGGRLATRVRRTPSVQTICSAPRAHSDLRQLLFADRTVVLSRHSERRVLSAGLQAERVRRIAPAIEPLAPLDSGERSRARRALGFEDQRPLLVYPGDLEFSSGAERMLRAHARLPEALAVQLAMACRAKTPAAAERERVLRELSRTLGTGTRVRFLGEVADMRALLGAADVVALPAEDLYAKLDYPLVLLEAMSLERAVLVVEGTSAAELADDGAAVACAADDLAVAAQLQRLLGDQSLRAELGRTARAAICKRHDPADMAQAYETLYDEALTEK